MGTCVTVQVWDHVLCNPPWFYPYVALSYLLSNRVAILRADAAGACPALQKRPASLDVTRLLRRAAMALETSPPDARMPEEPLRPLPAGAEYAPFEGGYPPQALQAQRGDRARLLGQQTAIVERRRTLSELQVRSLHAPPRGASRPTVTPRQQQTTFRTQTSGGIRRPLDGNLSSMLAPWGLQVSYLALSAAAAPTLHCMVTMHTLACMCASLACMCAAALHSLPATAWTPCLGSIGLSSPGLVQKMCNRWLARGRLDGTRSGMQGRGQQLAVETAVMLREREQLSEVAAERREAIRALEGRMARERALLEAQSKAERLRQISLLEDQYSCALPPTPSLD